MDILDKKFLVTGGTGFLGSWVVEKLEQKGVPRENISIPRFPADDLRDFGVCTRLVNDAQIVIHCAAVTGNAEFHRQNPGKIFFDNAAMALNLLEAAKRKKVVKFIGIGSATEYPDQAPLPHKEENLWDGMPGETNLAYSIAKRMMAAQSGAYAKEGSLVALHLIPTNMYGPRDDIAKQYFIMSLIQKISQAKKKNLPAIEMSGSGNSTRDFLYVEDAAEAVIAACENYEGADPVNIGSGQEVAISKVAEIVASLVGFTGDIVWSAGDEASETRRVLDAERAKRAFGFTAATTLRRGLQKTVDWYKNL